MYGEFTNTNACVTNGQSRASCGSCVHDHSLLVALERERLIETRGFASSFERIVKLLYSKCMGGGHIGRTPVCDVWSLICTSITGGD